MKHNKSALGMAFIRNIEELVVMLGTAKVRLVEHLTKNYKENKHYIITKDNSSKRKRHGGNNKSEN